MWVYMEQGNKGLLGIWSSVLGFYHAAESRSIPCFFTSLVWKEGAFWDFSKRGVMVADAVSARSVAVIQDMSHTFKLVKETKKSNSNEGNGDE